MNKIELHKRFLAFGYRTRTVDDCGFLLVRKLLGAFIILNTGQNRVERAGVADIVQSHIIKRNPTFIFLTWVGVHTTSTFAHHLFFS